MTARDKLWLVFAVWACVYPGVLIFDYGFKWAEIDWPAFVTVAISTACTVPLISLIISPKIEKLIARAENETRAELKMDEARAAKGPDPADLV